MSHCFIQINPNNMRDSPLTLGIGVHMNVKAAINMMVKNPAVDFPWELSVYGLVNSFLPDESQLDPHTATAVDVQKAVMDMDVVTQEMLYTSVLTPVRDIQPPSAAALGNGLDTSTDHDTKKRNTIFILFGGTICVIALMLTSHAGGIVLESKDIVELLKVLIHALTATPAE